MNIRRKKSTLTEVKVAVVGAHGVGKTGILAWSIFQIPSNNFKTTSLIQLFMSFVSYIFALFSALTVRFLTKRYIGEYDHQTGKYANFNNH
jgi:hypothetical protein